MSNAPGQTAIAANGNRSRNNNFMIDGTDNNDVNVTLPTVPVVAESVAEVVVQTNPFNVEYGRNSGAQVNIVTKGGSNRFRGSAFEYYQDSSLNARDNVEKRAGQADPTEFTRHQSVAASAARLSRTVRSSTVSSSETGTSPTRSVP